MEMYKLVAVIVGFISVIVAIYGLIRWANPITINPDYTVSYDDSTPDVIWAEITNNSKENQYITECLARPIRPKKYILKKMLTTHSTHPHQLELIKFCGQSFNLLETKPTKIEPLEPLKLSHKLNLTHPLGQFLGPEFTIQVKLSNGKKFQSKPLPAPKKWLFTGNISHKNKKNGA